MKVYISGRITGLSQDEYTSAFGRAEAMLLDMDHDPVNPLKVPACETEDCADSDSKKEDGSFLHTWACYLKSDLRALLDCDAIAMLPNWEVSKGAELELHVAKKCGLEYYLIRHDFAGLV